MKWLNGYRMMLVLVGFVAAIMLGGSANADFTFGEPTNLGPMVNSSHKDNGPCISADSLSLYFCSNRPGGHGNLDLWITVRATIGEPWSEPVNLGPIVNSSSREAGPYISADGLELYFQSDRLGGQGDRDIWVTTRSAKSEPWSEPVNLGPMVNSSSREASPCLSSDGLELYFQSDRLGGQGDGDIWVTTRKTTTDSWVEPVNLGPAVNGPALDGTPYISADGLMLFFRSIRGETYGSGDIWYSRRLTVADHWNMPAHPGPPVNTSAGDSAPNISADGSTLYFHSNREGSFGDNDLYQAPIIPIVDLNSDGIVDAADMVIMIDHWGTDEPLCDIGPMPWGDVIVDVQDLIVLAEHLFEEIPPAEPVE
jgi:Tol biopolymer transport system component